MVILATITLMGVASCLYPDLDQSEFWFFWLWTDLSDFTSISFLQRSLLKWARLVHCRPSLVSFTSMATVWETCTSKHW